MVLIYKLLGKWHKELSYLLFLYIVYKLAFWFSSLDGGNGSITVRILIVCAALV